MTSTDKTQLGRHRVIESEAVPYTEFVARDCVVLFEVVWSTGPLTVEDVKVR